MTVELADGEVPVRVTGDDLGTCMDILLENVFAHTSDGSALAIRLSRRPRAEHGCGGRDGPGFGNTDPTERAAHRRPPARPGHRPPDRGASGGTLTIGHSARAAGR